ncbi:rod-determining factor RdfA [Halorarius halobius]|uniref:rod-determining factor RdfA n=1 Tax=Halorarius halobius TaxID=2962671 RepID=UPI0020CF96D5|nr:rod-determining factor RdfA [Halorarius halobius]
MTENMGEVGGDPCCKAGRLERKYDLMQIDEELIARWRGEGAEETSVRVLTEEFNKELLRAALDRGDINYFEGEIDNTYRLLTDDDVTEGVRINVRRALKRANVDIEGAEDDFVSHQTIYNHLTGCLDVSKPQKESKDPVDTVAGEIFSLQNRTVAVADSKLERLRDQNRIAIDEFDVFVDVNVLCKHCQTQHELGRLLRNGGCTCQVEE